MTIPFNYIQTFYADSETVGYAVEVLLTSVEIYFKQKPNTLRNTSGTSAPGVTVSICEVQDQSPDPTRILPYSTTRVAYNDVYSFSDSSVPTVFSFSTPVVLQTGRFYGIVMSFEDTQYEVWTNKQGDRLVGTNTPSAGSGSTKDGKFYQKTNANLFIPISDTDLKYKVNVAKFTANTVEISLVNKDYEFLTFEDRTGNFRGGEFVYQNAANATGNIAVTTGNTTLIGNGTDFTTLIEGNYIVAVSGSNAQVLQIHSVTNATHLVTNTTPHFSNSTSKFKVCPVGKVYWTDNITEQLYLVDSSANSTIKFAVAANVVGEISGATANIVSVDTYDVDEFIPKFEVAASASAALNFSHVLAYSNGTAWIVAAGNYESTEMGKTNRVAKYDGRILSRSLEVAETNLFSNAYKSSVVKMTVNVATSTSFNVPRIRTSEIDFFVHQNEISNTYLDGSTDTEVNKNGLAVSKGITKKVSFANNRFAEDLRVYLVAYRPEGTDIRVYAKLHNSNDPETFDDKLWTPLRAIQNGSKYSSKEDIDDLNEYEFGLQQYPDTETVLPGSFTTSNGSVNIFGNGVAPNSYVTGNDLIKLYNPVIPENYMVVAVASSNTTAITLSTEVANDNVIGSGFVVDKLRYKGTAFTNGLNGNIVRYFTTGLVEVDKFNSMQFKIVFLSNSTSLIPSVDSIHAVGVNAGDV